MSLLLEALAIVAAICVCGLLLRRATGHWQWRLAASAIVVVVAGAMAATYTVTSGRALVRGWHEAHALSARAQEIRAGQRLSVNVDFVEWLGRRIPRGDSYYLVQGARPHPSRRLFSWATFRLLPRFQAASKLLKSLEIPSRCGSACKCAGRGRLPSIRRIDSDRKVSIGRSSCVPARGCARERPATA